MRIRRHTEKGLSPSKIYNQASREEPYKTKLEFLKDSTVTNKQMWNRNSTRILTLKPDITNAVAVTRGR